MFFLSNEYSKNLSTQFKTVSTYPVYHYPYTTLATKLASQGEKSISLFAYGSLVDRNSAAETLSLDALRTHTAAVGFGIQRVFNRDVTIQPNSGWEIPCNPSARGMLNVQKTLSPLDYANGALIEVPLSDIPSLLDRETGYDLVPILVANWDDFIDQRADFKIAYVLSAPANTIYTSSSILPRPGYYELTRDAAKEFGPLFAQVWQETTYLANGQIPISAWENALQKGDPKTGVYGKNCLKESPT